MDFLNGKRIGWPHLFAMAPVIALFIWYRVPILGQVICDTDISGIIYSGWGLSEGLLPYKDIFETKPPGTYFLFALIIKIFGINILPLNIFGIIWATLGLFALFILTSKLVDAKAGLFAAMAYSIVSASDFFNGICPNYETWAITPGLFGLVLFLIAMESPKANLPAYFAGVLLALSVSMKFQGLFFSVAAGIALISYGRPLSVQNPRKIINVGAMMVLGGASIFLFYFAFYLFNGAGSSLLAALNPKQGASYAKARTISLISENLISNISMFVRNSPIICISGGLSFGALYVARKRESWDLQKMVLLFSWWLSLFFAAFFLKGLISDGQFYNHYLVIALPGFCAIFGFTASTLLKIPKAWPLIIIALGAALIHMFLGQYEEFNLACESYEVQKRDGVVVDKYIISQHRDMESMYGIRISYFLKDISRYLNKNTEPGETIFVWDSVSMIYIFAQRRAPTYYYKPYFSSAHLPWSIYKEGDTALDEIRFQIINELRANPPVFVIHLTQVLAEFPHLEPIFKELKLFLIEKYEMDKNMVDGAFTVWKLKNHPFLNENGVTDITQ